MKYALISVSDKSNLIEFAKELTELSYNILTTGGTKQVLSDASINCISIEEFTGSKEMLDGRVKTLHPKIHGGILSDRDNPIHLKEVSEYSIEFIDLVIVNLYPFKETISKENVPYDEAIENIDIGGPSMLRSAAKNHKYVSVVCDYLDYSLILSEIKEFGKTTDKTRSYLAAKAFRHTANYDSVISNYFTTDDYTETMSITYELERKLRYGENPHQSATLYKGSETSYSVVHAKKLHGKELSYNNILDANASLEILSEFNEATVVAIKHTNPCGIGSGSDLSIAWNKAYESDPVSIFGGVISTNREVTKEVAQKMSKIFLEIIIAPSFSSEALEILKSKKNLRLLEFSTGNKKVDKQYVSINGGLLVQEKDNTLFNDLKVVTDIKPTDEQMNDLLFALKGVKHVKSNAILLAKNQMTLGIGTGQTSRIGALELALKEASKKGVKDMVLASDGFFPFDDVVRLAASNGVKAIIQPGGSIKDSDSIKACNELGLSMVFTNMRHFKH